MTSQLGTRYAVFKAASGWYAYGYREPQWKVATIGSDAHGPYYVWLATYLTWQEAMARVNQCIKLDKEIG